MTHHHALFAALLLTSSLALFGCDGQDPGVAGHVSLSPAMDSTPFTSLEIRAIPVDNDGFNLAVPAFPTEVAPNTEPSPDDETALVGSQDDPKDGTILLQRSQPLSAIKFPLEYSVGGWEIGYTKYGRWRLFAWLTDAADPTRAVRPALGEPYGTTLFDVPGCGAFMSEHCGVAADVDVTIELAAP